jgi:hypothetical protein
MMEVYRHETDSGCVVLQPACWCGFPVGRTADQPGWYEVAASDLIDYVGGILDLEEMTGARTGKSVVSRKAWLFLTAIMRQAQTTAGHVRLSAKQLDWLQQLHAQTREAWRATSGDAA